MVVRLFFDLKILVEIWLPIVFLIAYDILCLSNGTGLKHSDY